MQTSLVIDLINLPEDGKLYSGDLSPSIYELPSYDAKPAGPLEYDLHIQRFENELLVRGTLSGAFIFACARDNQEFLQTITIEDFATSIEIESASIDLTDALREELLMAFPTYPNCENADDPHVCEIDTRYLALDKLPNDGVDDAPPSKSDSRWAALDDLENFKD